MGPAQARHGGELGDAHVVVDVGAQVLGGAVDGGVAAVAGGAVGGEQGHQVPGGARGGERARRGEPAKELLADRTCLVRV